MLKRAEYNKHAEACRQLARKFPPGPQQESMLEMARVWEQLDADRSMLLEKNPDLRREEEPLPDDTEDNGGCDPKSGLTAGEASPIPR